MKPDELEAALAVTQPTEADKIATLSLGRRAVSRHDAVTDPGEAEPQTQLDVPAVTRDEPVTEPQVLADTRVERPSQQRTAALRKSVTRLP